MKLKSIPDNTVVYTPTEEEAKDLLAILHENGYKWGFGSESLINLSHWNQYETATGYFIDANDDIIQYGDMDDRDNTDGYTILTLADFKERYALNEDNFVRSEEDKPQPKFKVGDKVRIIQDGTVNPDYVGIVDEIESIAQSIRLKNTDSNWFDSCLEPYTEPETKPTEDMETKEKEPEESGNNLENSQLNLCELLAGQEGEEFYSLMAGKCKLKGINEGAGLPIRIILDACAAWEYLTKDGKIYNVSDARSILFPSRALYEQYPLDPLKAWSVWQEEQKKPFICIHWGEVDCNGDEEVDYTGNTYFRTPADRDKCLSEIKAIIEKYSKK